MKTLNDYMEMSYRMEIIEDKEEGGFVVSYPDLPGWPWKMELRFMSQIVLKVIRDSLN